MTTDDFGYELGQILNFQCTEPEDFDGECIGSRCPNFHECHSHPHYYISTAYYKKYAVVSDDWHEVGIFDVDIVTPKQAAEIICNGATNPTRIERANRISVGSQWFKTLDDEIECEYVDINGIRYYFDDQYCFGGYINWARAIIKENNLSFEDVVYLNELLEQ